MATQDTPTPITGGLGVTQSEARSDSPALRASGLPSHYLPGVAGYAGGPWLTPELVTPSDWSWRSARTYVVRNADDGLDYRAIRVYSGFAPGVGNECVGYWAVERLGDPLTLPELEN